MRTLTVFLGVTAVAVAAPLDDCLAAAGVPVDAKSSSGWNTHVKPFNIRLPYTPAAIAVPKTAEQISAAVICAAKNNVKVTPKGGGHSYASHSLGGENGHLVIELSPLDKVTVDQATGMANVEPGARLGHVATELNRQGRRAISHGTCPGVGVAGHALHGGFGFSSHRYGLALDWIAGAQVVLANGTITEVNDKQNPDLYWALRGAGSSFFIVSMFRFNTFIAPTTATVFQANLPWTSASSATTGWLAIQDYMLTGGMPAEMNMRVFGGSGYTQLQGVYQGTQQQLQTAIQPLLSKLGTSLSMTRQTDWMSSFSAYANGQTIDAKSLLEQENFFCKSLVTTQLTKEVMTSATNYWMNTARGITRQWYIIIDMYGGKNAYIQPNSQGSMSYAHRDKLFLFEFYDRVAGGTYPSNGFSFLNGWTDAFTKLMAPKDWGMYYNYADPVLNRTYAQEVYYRENLPRLRQIKAAIDPAQVFDYPQAIEPAK